MIHGRVNGLKPSQLKRLEQLARRRVPLPQIVSPELARQMAAIARELNRQVGVLIDRRGHVSAVMVGDAARLELPDLGRSRAGRGRFRGVRLVHTHLNGEALTRDDLTDLAMLRLDLIACVHADDAGWPRGVEYAHLLPPRQDGELFARGAFDDVHHPPFDASRLIAEIEAEFRRAIGVREIGDQRPRAILICVSFKHGELSGLPPVDERANELRELADTAGLNAVDVVTQRRDKPDPRFFIGRGKLDEVLLRSTQLAADAVVFDHDLTPAQSRTIGDAVEIDVLDRTQLILEIFARRAKSQVGRLQVELARLKYAFPRLNEKEAGLSRITGGIGAQGPGETKLEILRRRARDRMHRVERELERLAAGRRLRRGRRKEHGVPVVSIVGYTNAGKSTLLNTLTRSAVLAEDRLFATLDTTSRRLRFPREREIIVTDTVGFIRDLPPDLVKAFRSTLEELEDADLLLHVIDASRPEWPAQAAVVEEIVATLDLTAVPVLRVYNKIDAIDPERRDGAPGHGVPGQTPDGGIAVSARERLGLEALMFEMERLLWRPALVQPAAAGPSTAQAESVPGATARVA